MKDLRALAIVLAALPACAALPQPQQRVVEVPPNTWGRHVRVLGGTRSLESGWAPIDDQTIYGFELDMHTLERGFGWELGFLHSEEDSGLTQGQLSEIYGGMRRTFSTKAGRLHPFIAGGTSIADVLLDDGSDSVDGYLLGLYVRGGARYDLSRRWHLSLDLRWTLGYLDAVFGNDIDIDRDLTGYQVVGGLGYSF